MTANPDSANDSSGKCSLKIVVKGYVPVLRNQLNGCHWKTVENQKIRTGMLLLASLKSGSLFIQSDPPTTTDTTSRRCKIFASRLASYRRTDGTLLLQGRSVPARLQRKGKKGRKLKSPPQKSENYFSRKNVEARKRLANIGRNATKNK